MRRGIIQNPEKGKKYKIYVTEVRFIIVLYLGMGDWLKQLWQVVETGETITVLPLMIGYEAVPD